MSVDESVLDTLDEETIPAQDNETPSMDETIRKTWEEISARESGVEEQAASDRQRDEKGRFAPKTETRGDVVTKPAQDALTDESAITEQAEKPVEAAPVIGPELQSLGLTKEDAEALSKLPDEAKQITQQILTRRFEKIRKGVEAIQTRARFGETMERVIAPYMTTIQGLGIQPDVAVQSLLSADNTLRRGDPAQKLEMIKKIARDYGVPLDPSNTAESQPVDPQIHTLQTQLQQMQQWITQQNQMREWQERNSLNSDIEKFAVNHAHFNDVRNDMAGLLQAGLASSLDEAYEKAIYANPTVRAKVLQEQQAKAEETRRAQAAAQAQAAKLAAAGNVRRIGRVSSAKPIGTMDDTIRAEAERLGLIQ